MTATGGVERVCVTELSAFVFLCLVLRGRNRKSYCIVVCMCLFLWLGVCVSEKETEGGKNTAALWSETGRCSGAYTDMSLRICHIRRERPHSLWCTDPAAGWCCLAVATQQPPSLGWRGLQITDPQ